MGNLFICTFIQRPPELVCRNIKLMYRCLQAGKKKPSKY